MAWISEKQVAARMSWSVAQYKAGAHEKSTAPIAVFSRLRQDSLDQIHSLHHDRRPHTAILLKLPTL
jgi:hypothetical protein